MSSSSDMSKCAASSSNSGMNEEAPEISSNKKVSTSCDQKVESCNRNNDGVDHNTSSNIDVSDSLGRVDISNDGDDKMSISDEKLFAAPPPKEDCPICFLPMPHADGICGVGKTYMPCCGKLLCEGCSIAEDDEMVKGNIKAWCSLRRLPLPKSNEEYIKRLKKRMQLNDARALGVMGRDYQYGKSGLPKNLNKAFELLKKSADLGSPMAHYDLAYAYLNGEGIEGDDEEKAFHHWKLAAIGGHEIARYYLGVLEKNAPVAMKHHMIAARSGYDASLKMVGEGYKAGLVTKDEYANTLRAYQLSVDEMKSRERDIAAAQR